MPRPFQVMGHYCSGKSFISWPPEEINRAGAVIFTLQLRKLNFREVKRYIRLGAVNKLKKKVKVKKRNIRFALLKMLQWEKRNLNRQQQILTQHLPLGTQLCLSCDRNFIKRKSRHHFIALQTAIFLREPGLSNNLLPECS